MTVVSGLGPRKGGVRRQRCRKPEHHQSLSSEKKEGNGVVAGGTYVGSREICIGYYFLRICVTKVCILAGKKEQASGDKGVIERGQQMG